MLTSDVIVQGEREFINLLTHCLGPELNKIKAATKAPGKGVLLTEFRKEIKFRDLIAGQFKIKGVGYRELSTSFIVPPENKQLSRLAVLIGSKGAGNDSDQIKDEGLEILEKLKEEGLLNKKQYKCLYYKLVT